MKIVQKELFPNPGLMKRTSSGNTYYLYDKGLVPVKEPFKKLVHQGMILGSNNIKMGKRYPEYVPSLSIPDQDCSTNVGH